MPPEEPRPEEAELSPSIFASINKAEDAARLGVARDIPVPAGASEERRNHMLDITCWTGSCKYSLGSI
ncbi:unnamed protein product [Boreogadus saida]